MRFQLLADGTLRTPSLPGQCLTSGGVGAAQAAFTACSPGLGSQQWAYSAATEQISTGAGSLCLALGGAGGKGSAVIGRPLADGAWAVGFFNAGGDAADVVCDADCLAGMGFEPTQAFHLRDLWDHADLPDAPAGTNITASALVGEGGVALLKLMPFFNAHLPPPPSREF